MIYPKQLYRWHGVHSVLILLLAAYILSLDLVYFENFLLGSQEFAPAESRDEPAVFSWMNTDGVVLSHIQGDPTICTEVIYTGNSRDPFVAGDDSEAEIVIKGWKALAHIVRTSPALKETTCFAFFKISTPWIDDRGRKFHPVWGRLPGTALVLAAFPKADFFLYMDSDALLAFPDKTPSSMYDTLAFDGYGENATSQQLQPGLIVNKPITGWMCSQCEKFELGHGCFNSGALLWYRPKAEGILRAWWESRNLDESNNIINSDGESFHGWNGDFNKLLGDKMGEQNRLMYVYAVNPLVREDVWVVPRQKSVEFNSESCPNHVDESHTPCLQSDKVSSLTWNPSKASCFISHYTDAKEEIIKHAEAMTNHQIRISDKRQPKEQ
mmetsp:Transcript_93727/g.190823  ORF Transcript_93727/g.190823 Transcript_93727/m.190823 type:complete len:382 (-) Transcript_93727:48-1193(-)